MKSHKIFSVALVFMLVLPAVSFAFGEDAGEHCWTFGGDNANGFTSVKSQVTRLDNFYNLNSRLTLANNDYLDDYPSAGTAYYSPEKGKITVNFFYSGTVGERPEELEIYLLDPKTLNGVHAAGAPGRTITHVPCTSLPR